MVDLILDPIEILADQFSGLQGILIFHSYLYVFGSVFTSLLIEGLSVDDAKKSTVKFANYTVPQIAKLTITATLVKNTEKVAVT